MMHFKHAFMRSSVWRHTDHWRHRSCDHPKQHVRLPTRHL